MALVRRYTPAGRALVAGAVVAAVFLAAAVLVLSGTWQQSP
jgi:hypothetical protein